MDVFEIHTHTTVERAISSLTVALSYGTRTRAFRHSLRERGFIWPGELAALVLRVFGLLGVDCDDDVKVEIRLARYAAKDEEQ